MAKAPANKEYQSDLARCFNNLGFSYAEDGQPTEALASVGSRSAQLREALFAAQPLNTSFRGDLARSHYYRARLQVRTGPDAEALANLKRAEELYEGVPVVGGPRIAGIGRACSPCLY